ncbi:MAG: DUF3482 domain-containing protein, partial [Lautropia sp.]
QAVRNVREEADVVLYLVNAAENPEDAGYVESEMQILEWVGKPIIVLLNQMGPPSGPQDEAAEIERWRAHLSYAPAVRQVMALDAFARCWVQEGALLKEVAKLLPDDKSAAFDRLHRAWQTQRREAFDGAMTVLAQRLARAALDKEKVPHGGLKGRLREVGSALGVTREKEDSAKQLAMQALAERLNLDIRDTTNRLIELHGLEGSAGDDVLTRLADHYAVTKHLSESRAAVVGGLVTGALAGLKADVVTGGLTLGGGMIAGGVLGALGAAGLARGYNMVRGTETVTVTWTDEVMNRLVASSLLAYLAVAHYGRGRGQWAQSEHPAFWESTVRDVLVQQGPNFNAFWRKRQSYKFDALVAAVQTELTLAAERVLIRLYPEAVSAAAIGTETARLSASARADAERLQREREEQAADASERAAADAAATEPDVADAAATEPATADAAAIAPADADAAASFASVPAAAADAAPKADSAPVIPAAASPAAASPAAASPAAASPATASPATTPQTASTAPTAGAAPAEKPVAATAATAPADPAAARATAEGAPTAVATPTLASALASFAALRAVRAPSAQLVSSAPLSHAETTDVSAAEQAFGGAAITESAAAEPTIEGPDSADEPDHAADGERNALPAAVRKLGASRAVKRLGRSSRRRRGRTGGDRAGSQAVPIAPPGKIARS